MAYISLNFKSKELVRGVSAEVILPTDCMAGMEIPTPYKTLYFLPGYGADSTEILQYLELRSQSELKGIAIVIVNGENAFYIDQPDYNLNYSKFIGEELIEVTRKLLPLSHRREDTFLGGISMGGYGALYNGARYHETFSKVVALSPCVDPYDVMVCNPVSGFSEKLFNRLFGNKRMYDNLGYNLLEQYTSKEFCQDIFLFCGKDDFIVYQQDKKFVEELRNSKVPVTYMETEGNHDIYTWSKALDAAFSYLIDIPEGTRNCLKI
ncbi:alpha/beta hydrolase [Clostridium sp. C105KSO13]|uniref:alpha/beta hydrolase n=1 Tax=Clostridium sp. C105KSO13 TaxID=1776045 RepID=UPI0007407932|nr:alpha/beta hydrolase-fold protein [Clostridium sp. C105KSO13]CUX33339.1 enterobactin/ferric enterobactin esterase [Clostridium sp. C105KSO13]